MKAYIYDKTTKEFLYDTLIQENPKHAGEYLMPPYSTLLQPPSQDGKVACFEGTWILKTDHRGHWQVKLADLTFSKVDYIGDAKEGYQFISDEVYDDYQSDHDKYKVVDGVFTDISDTEEYAEIKRQKEAQRISLLQCTKRVFVLMLEELGLDYFEQIEPAINANRQAKLEWSLCVELQRNNPLIDQLAGQFGITSAQLDMLFKVANGENTVEELRSL